jgi:hypothetical protein
VIAYFHGVYYEANEEKMNEFRKTLGYDDLQWDDIKSFWKMVKIPGDQYELIEDMSSYIRRFKKNEEKKEKKKKEKKNKEEKVEDKVEPANVPGNDPQ